MSVTRKKLPIPSFQHCTTFLFYLVRINSHRNVKMVYFSFSFFTQGKWSYLYLRLIYERKKRKRYLSNMFLLPPFFLYFFHNLHFFILKNEKEIFMKLVCDVPSFVCFERIRWKVEAQKMFRKYLMIKHFVFLLWRTISSY